MGNTGKRLFQIASGVLLAAALWTAVFFGLSALFGTGLPADYDGYAVYDAFEEAAVCDGESAVLREEKAIVNGTHAFENLSLESPSAAPATLVVAGEIRVAGALRLDGVSLVIDGSLFADELRISSGGELFIRNNGVFEANAVVRAAALLSFYNTGEAEIGNSTVYAYHCETDGRLQVGEQRAACEIYVDTWDETLSGSGRRLRIESFSRSDVYTATKLFDGGEPADAAAYLYDDAGLVFSEAYVYGMAVWLAVLVTSALLCLVVLHCKRGAQTDMKKAGGYSCFTAGVLPFFLLKFVYRLAQIASFGFLRPYLDERFRAWQARHTRLDGQPLRFSGRGETIFYRSLLWSVLEIVTLGIYAFWAEPKYMRWLAQNTSCADETADSRYAGTPKALFFAVIGSLVRYFVAAVAYVFVIAAAVIFAGDGNMSQKTAAVVVLLVFLAATLLLAAYLLRVYCKLVNDLVQVTLGQATISGRALFCRPIELRQFARFLLLTVVTLGGFSFVLDYELTRLVTECTGRIEPDSGEAG